MSSHGESIPCSIYSEGQQVRNLPDCYAKRDHGTTAMCGVSALRKPLFSGHTGPLSIQLSNAHHHGPSWSSRKMFPAITPAHLGTDG
jgi:hypothetical protein